MPKPKFSIAGDPELFSLEHRILNGSCFIAVLIAISSLFINSFSTFPFLITISLVIISIVFLLLYYYSRIKRVTRYIKVLFFIFAIYILSVGWFTSQGIYGSMPYYYLIALFTFLMMSDTGSYKYIIPSFILYLILLFIVQTLFPDYILPFQSQTAHFFDLSTSLVMGLLALSFLGITLKRNYNLERLKVECQKTELEKAYQEIEQNNIRITESISYAKYIQAAMLPFDNLISKALPEYFILYKPKDIVSGDFYWFHDTGSKIIIAAADCTGHGVPGAFMSMIGNDLLNHIIKFQQIYQPDQILFELHKGIVHALKQSESTSRDGIDIALCCIDKDLNKLEFSGAMRPLFLVQDNILREIKGDRKTIGDFVEDSSDERIYNKHSFEITSNTSFYIFSDGYADQFGGIDNKKYTQSKFRELLVQISNKSMSEQKKILDESFGNWKTGNQTDDVLVIGVRLNQG